MDVVKRPCWFVSECGRGSRKRHRRAGLVRLTPMISEPPCRIKQKPRVAITGIPVVDTVPNLYRLRSSFVMHAARLGPRHQHDRYRILQASVEMVVVHIIQYKSPAGKPRHRNDQEPRGDPQADATRTPLPVPSLSPPPIHRLPIPTGGSPNTKRRSCRKENTPFPLTQSTHPWAASSKHQ